MSNNQTQNLILLLEDSVIRFHSTTNNDERKNLDIFLSQSISTENIYIFKEILFDSNSPYSKNYAANSLIKLITQNFISVNIQFKEELYTFLAEYIFKNSLSLFSTDLKFLFKSLIELLCRIVRVSFLQSNVFMVENLNHYLNGETNGDSINSKTLTLLMIFSELLSQFQISSLPPTNK